MEAQGMVDKVAAAIFEEMDLTDGLDLSVAQRYALAAIKAMREPTEEMLKIGETRTDRGGVYLNWIQMIDAALNEHEEKK